MVCLITDRTLSPDRSLEAVVAAAVEGGVNMVQLREKDLPPDELYSLAHRIRGAIGHDALLIINGSLKVAIEIDADGVHLPSDAGLSDPDPFPPPLRGGIREGGSTPNPSLTLEIARRGAGATLLVGRSVHSLPEVARAAADGADYVELGTIYPSRSHPGGAAQGVQAITQAARSGLPVLAVGGITPANAPDVIAGGASGVAVISSILADSDPRAAARRLVHAVQAAWERAESSPAASAARDR
jgi:thiamine-phosphate pyrophosphorylase